eukprot:jgi/Botrbrau1/13576/Bobra.0307s0001.2
MRKMFAVNHLPKLLGLWHCASRSLRSRDFGRSFSDLTSRTGLVKQLRERSGSPISEVKAALEETGWNFETAFQTLRTKGLAAANQKTSRTANQGLLGLRRESATSATVVEVNCETDFVARNERFQDLVLNVARAASNSSADEVPGLEVIDTEALLHHGVVDGIDSVRDAIASVGASVRENIRLRRGYRLVSPSGAVACYAHGSLKMGLGRIAAMVALEHTDRELQGAELSSALEFGEKLAMHVVAMNPMALDADGIPPEVLEDEKRGLERAGHFWTASLRRSWKR